MSAEPTVLVADDQTLVRAGLVALLTAAGVPVVGEAADGAEAVRLAADLVPDVVLMDIRMPVLNGLDATAEILRGPEPRPRVLVLTTFDLDEYVYAALAAGATGFLLKDTPPARIVDAVRTAGDGDLLLAPALTRRLVERFLGSGAHVDAPYSELTPRETEVLGHVGRGASNAEIAADLVLSEETVKTHVKRVMAKLHLTSRAQAVVVAYESGLVRPGGGPGVGGVG